MLTPLAERHAVGRALLERRDLLGGAWWSFVAAVIVRGANLAGLVLCARILSQADFGAIAVIQSTVGMFGPVAGLGLAMTTTKFLAEFRDRDRERAGRAASLSPTRDWW